MRASTLFIATLASHHLRSAASTAVRVSAEGGVSGVPFRAMATMRAVVAQEGRAVLAQRPIPAPQAGELLVKVTYSAINRADTLQRAGKYPPPRGVTDILGLEAVGTVESVGAGTAADAAFRPGDAVMALLGGGGNAEFVTVNATHALRLPRGMDVRTAAAVPETWLTAYQLLRLVGRVAPGETVLVHAAASGVGTAAVQLARAFGVSVIAVAGSDAKLEAVKALGAAHGVNYKAEEAWGGRVLALTGGRGVDLILDPVGGSFWRNNAEAVAMDGRWVLYGSMGGVKVDGGLFASVLSKRVTLQGTTLRSRSDEYKAGLVAAFARDVLPLLDAGTLAPLVDREFALEDVQAAHEYMESNANIGKVVLRVAAT